MKKNLLLLHCFIIGFSITVPAQLNTFVRTTQFTGDPLPSMVHSNVKELKGIRSSLVRGYAVAATTSGSVLSYCHNSFRMPARHQSLVLYDASLVQQKLNRYYLYDRFTNRPTQPPHVSYFEGNSSSHHLVELRNRNILLSGAVELFLHNPYPNEGCFGQMFSSKLSLVQFDPNGNIIWARGYDIPVTKSKVLELSNREIIVVANNDAGNMYYLWLDSGGNLLESVMYEGIDIADLTEQKSGNVLVTGSSTKYNTTFSPNRADVVCLSFYRNATLYKAISIGGKWNDYAAAVKYNAGTGNYFILVNTEKQHLLNPQQYEYDVMGIECNEYLKPKSIKTWGSYTSSELAYDVLIDTVSTNDIYTFHGIIGYSNQNGGWDFNHNLLFKSSLQGSVQFGTKYPTMLTPHVTYIQLPPQSSNPWMNTISLPISLPKIPTSFNLFKTNSGDYLNISPLIKPVPAGSLYSIGAGTMQWRQTNSKGEIDYPCDFDKVSLLELYPEIVYTQISPKSGLIWPSQHPLHYFSSHGNLVDSDECGNSNFQKPVSVTAPAQKETGEFPAFECRVYPNPAFNLVNIMLPGQFVYPIIEVQIIDASGIIVQKNTLVYAASNIQLSVTGLKKGIYLVKIKAGKETFTTKLIKQ